ncbi:unnamed protein product [Schistocephalus solidus]|uniref:Uncharacterized protein n=1 Tax=Schistocephalus solidus TaxID=70667 RepID=A0A183TAR0_SCHSO|nr:unnamed protein product [Schistocephalus solidus]
MARQDPRQINPENWEGFARITTVKKGAAIYEANQIAAAKAKRSARKLPVSRTYTANAQALPTQLPHSNRPDQTSSDAMQQQSHNSNFCLNLCQPAFGPPPPPPPAVTPGTNFPTPNIIAITPQYSTTVTSTTATTTKTLSPPPPLMVPRS